VLLQVLRACQPAATCSRLLGFCLLPVALLTSSRLCLCSNFWCVCYRCFLGALCASGGIADRLSTPLYPLCGPCKGSCLGHAMGGSFGTVWAAVSDLSSTPVLSDLGRVAGSSQRREFCLPVGHCGVCRRVSMSLVVPAAIRNLSGPILLSH
jgi:hypothetical protein